MLTWDNERRARVLPRPRVKLTDENTQRIQHECTCTCYIEQAISSAQARESNPYSRHSASQCTRIQVCGHDIGGCHHMCGHNTKSRIMGIKLADGCPIPQLQMSSWQSEPESLNVLYLAHSNTCAGEWAALASRLAPSAAALLPHPGASAL